MCRDGGAGHGGAPRRRFNWKDSHIGIAPPRVLNTPLMTGPDGMPARRVFTPEMSASFDPFLYFVHFGPRELHETNWGFPAHPHKGFETITYMLEGSLEHRDSAGGHAILEPGDVQWVTAGKGIIHSEIPPAAFQQSGGTVDGFQIWLNLASRHKSAPAGYQMLRAGETPIARPASGVTLRIIGGELGDKRSPVRMLTPVNLIHARLDRGAAWHHELSVGHNAFAYVIAGACEIESAGGTTGGEAGQVTVFGADNDAVTVTPAGSGSCDLLFLSGAPIDEPIAAHGPFVMTSRDEIIAAIEEYNSGRMGRL